MPYTMEVLKEADKVMESFESHLVTQNFLFVYAIFLASGIAILISLYLKQIGITEQIKNHKP